ncbi:MAG: hypothetical protein L0Z49_11985 [Actinobacteria bacterium]|nr:hypothetical protein [Actinomycetota bacterium]
MRIEIQGTTLPTTVRQIEAILGPVEVRVVSNGGSAIVIPAGGGEDIPVFQVYSDFYVAVIRVDEDE